MLNYIWSGLILISIVFASVHDLSDEWNNTYHNNKTYQAHYLKTDNESFVILKLQSPATAITARVVESGNKIYFSVPVTDSLPAHWQQVAQLQSAKDKTQLALTTLEHDRKNAGIRFSLPEIHWLKIRALTDAAFDMAEFAVKLALGLAGIMALWLGLMRIAEKSGLIFSFVRLVRPLLRWLFPEIPKDHPALGSISLNMAANVLGLGNAATPLGIKAMQQLQELNTKKDQASNSMCMFLAINTSSVQLLPPVTLIALMGTQVAELIVPIILATTASTIAAVLSVKLFVRADKSSCN